MVTNVGYLAGYPSPGELYLKAVTLCEYHMKQDIISLKPTVVGPDNYLYPNSEYELYAALFGDNVAINQ